MELINVFFIFFIYNNRARNIFNTPLLASVINDVSTCKLEKDGAYTVRSAYKNIMNHNFPTLQHCVSRNGMFVSLNCNQRLRISCGENVVIVCQQEFGCNQKVFNVLICANCVKGMLKIVLICFCRVS